jgi:hypothetical protein
LTRQKCEAVQVAQSLPARRIDTHARFHFLLRHRFDRLDIGLRGRRLDACEDGKEK